MIDSTGDAAAPDMPAAPAVPWSWKPQGLPAEEEVKTMVHIANHAPSQPSAKPAGNPADLEEVRNELELLLLNYEVPSQIESQIEDLIFQIDML